LKPTLAPSRWYNFVTDLPHMANFADYSPNCSPILTIADPQTWIFHWQPCYKENCLTWKPVINLPADFFNKTWGFSSLLLEILKGLNPEVWGGLEFCLAKLLLLAWGSIWNRNAHKYFETRILLLKIQIFFPNVAWWVDFYVKMNYSIGF
jgi:hypothetical protein